MKSWIKIVGALVFAFVCVKLCGGSQDVDEVTFILDRDGYNKFEVTLYADGTAQTEYEKCNGKNGVVECEWAFSEATYHNQKAEFYLVNISIEGYEESHAFRKGSNEAYFYVGSLYADPNVVGRQTLGSSRYDTYCIK